jgi:hypothetical protein
MGSNLETDSIISLQISDGPPTRSILKHYALNWLNFSGSKVLARLKCLLREDSSASCKGPLGTRDFHESISILCLFILVSTQPKNSLLPMQCGGIMYNQATL